MFQFLHNHLHFILTIIVSGSILSYCLYSLKDIPADWILRIKALEKAKPIKVSQFQELIIVILVLYLAVGLLLWNPFIKSNFEYTFILFLINFFDTLMFSLLLFSKYRESKWVEKISKVLTFLEQAWNYQNRKTQPIVLHFDELVIQDINYRSKPNYIEDQECKSKETSTIIQQNQSSFHQDIQEKLDTESIEANLLSEDVASAKVYNYSGKPTFVELKSKEEVSDIFSSTNISNSNFLDFYEILKGSTSKFAKVNSANKYFTHKGSFGYKVFTLTIINFEYPFLVNYE